MAANVETMAYGRGIPWHALGTKTDTPLTTAAEMLTAAQLDWRVTKTPMWTRFEGNDLPVPNRWANVRQTDGAVLGDVGDNYQIVQNGDAFAWADSLVDSGDAKYETAGSLFGGRRIFLTMELPDGVSIPGDNSEIKPYLLITNGHDGGTILQASVTMVRVVCANTWTLALAGATRTFRIRHSGSIDGKLAAARDALGITFTYTVEFQELARRLSSLQVAERQVDQILRAAFPIPEKQDVPDKIDKSEFYQVRETYRNSPAIDPIRGTGWGVLQAAGEYLDHEVDYHGRRFPAADIRAYSILYDGTAATKKQAVLDILTPMVRVPVRSRR
jgi:phage/plasmid-like protein (TIGR03299 family)